MAEERQSFPEGYKRPAVWAPSDGGNTMGGMNQPTAGPRSEEALQKGQHPLQIYTLATPNGVKVTVLLEELGADYDAWICSIMKLQQFTAGFTECNPNSKIPTMYDYSDPHPETGKPLRIFESGAILLYLADKYKKLVPPVTEVSKRQECLNWLFWQTGTGPYMGGGFGHFTAYAPVELKYCIDRFAMEVKRELDVLNRHFGGEDPYFDKEGQEGGEKKTRQYILGDEYSIADIALFPWVKAMRDGYPGPWEGAPRAGEFLDFNSYEHVKAWVERIEIRPAVKRGRKVGTSDMPERHSKEDFPKEDYE